MGSSSTPPPPFFSSPLNPPSWKPRCLRIQASSSSLASPRPRTKRKNHLRPKLPPQTLQPTPPPPPSDPTIDHLLLLEEAVVIEEAVQEVEGIDPFPPVDHGWCPLPVVELSLRFAALIAVQTVIAVWFLSSGDVEERSDGGCRVEGVGEGKEEVGRKVAEDKSEFERKVSEIKAMAREARASEVNDVAKVNGVKSISNVVIDDKNAASPSLVKNIGGEMAGGKSNSRRKIGFLGSNAKNRKPPEGFSGAKGRDKRIDVSNGGIRQIAHHNSAERPIKLQEQRESSQLVSKTAGKFPDAKTSVFPPLEGSSNGGHDPSVSDMRNDNSFSEDTESALSFKESSSHMPCEILSNTSLVENENMQLETQIEKNFIEESPNSSALTGNIKGRSECGSQNNEIEQKPILDKDNEGLFDTGNKSWWLKLPFVFGIFLHRGSDSDDVLKGLYSFNVNSSEDDGNFLSYIVAFQDRIDATNFCYILESFFEELGDFSADIVPLTIQELDEAVKSGTSKVIVVRKRQLRLYAGQPLTEVEAAIRSFVD